MAAVKLEALPFKEAIKSFRSKGYKITFDHQEMMKEDHAYGFTVAKAMRTDILQDIRNAVDNSIANGMTFADFKKTLKPTLQEKGWWGVKTMTDPSTGEEKDVQLGSSRRLRTIFDTNMRTSYAAGRWEQVQRTKEIFPYLRYITVHDDHVRAEHKAWHNVVKPVDDPFWNDHYPPNGWGCRCSVQQVADADLERLGLKITNYDPVGPDRNVVNRSTGQLMKVPQGISPGFNYNPGKARMRALTPPPLDRLLDVPYAGDPTKVPMPKARALPPESVMADGLPEQEYVQAFLQQFGAGVGSPKVFEDIAGEPVVISDDLFKDARGTLKATRNARNKYLPLLAAAIKSPDEIWNIWELPHGANKTAHLRRRYLRRVSDGKSQGIAVFETGQNGWVGVTTFQTKDKSYIEKQRRGTLVYRRPDDEGK